jgi:hypothetical protein
MIKKIVYKKKILGLIVNLNKKINIGTRFFSPNSFTQQVGVINYKKKHFIKPHSHNSYLRKIYKTSEVLLIKKGILRVDFYDKKKYIFSKIAKKNNLLVLQQGSHGFKIIKDCLMIEVKQGPFVKNLDKVRFNKIDEKKIKIKK